MGAASITLPHRLGEKLREKAEETGYLPKELGVEFVRKGLNENLSIARKDDDFVDLFHIANSLHRNFYESQMGKRSIEVAMRDIKRFMAKLRVILS